MFVPCCEHPSHLRSLLLYHHYFPVAHQHLEAYWPESLLCTCSGRSLALVTQSWSILLAFPAVLLQPETPCIVSWSLLIAFKCLESCVAALKGSVGRADAEGRGTITPFIVESWLGWKEGNLEQARTWYRGLQNECDCPYQTLEYL